MERQAQADLASGDDEEFPDFAQALGYLDRLSEIRPDPGVKAQSMLLAVGLLSDALDRV